MIPKTLLVIDDNSDCTTLIKFALELNTNWQVFTANDSERGIALAHS